MNTTKKLSVCAVVVMLLSGCAAVNEHNVSARKEKTSPVIGCAPKDIAIEITAPVTWTATCRQKVFYCKIVPGMLDTSATCTPALQ
jgi:PBP1b-binding outer membrane lipoprotein LpoB